MKKIFAILKRQTEILLKGYLGLAYALAIGTLCVFGIFAVYETLGNQKQDVSSTSLYYPFAIFAACCAICFSWVRALDPSQTVKIERVRLCAENFLLSAVLFLIGSLFKLFTLHPLNDSKTVTLIKHYTYLINWTFPFIFIIA